MTARDLPLELLLSVLPQGADTQTLAREFLAAAVPDPLMAWSRSSEYSTYDRRIVRAHELVGTIRRAERANIELVRGFYDSLAAAAEAIAAEQPSRAAGHLIEYGEKAEAADRASEARAFYDAAVRLLRSQTAPDGMLVLALRRLGRANIAISEYAAAAAAYSASLGLADGLGDRDGRTIAMIGLGNVQLAQGRLAAGILAYEQAWRACEPDQVTQQAQIAINLSTTHRELGQLDAAQEWLTRAKEWLASLTADEQAGWHNTRGLIDLSAGRPADAEDAFNEALALATTDQNRAMVLDNLAEVRITAGQLDAAYTLARDAEMHALRAGSERALADIYTTSGRICRLREDPNGVTFFEKAIELYQRRDNRLGQAKVYVEYMQFKRVLGDVDEASAYLSAALDLVRELGHETLTARFETLQQTSP